MRYADFLDWPGRPLNNQDYLQNGQHQWEPAEKINRVVTAFSTIKIIGNNKRGESFGYLIASLMLVLTLRMTVSHSCIKLFLLLILFYQIPISIWLYYEPNINHNRLIL
ncbi:hypothetical protein CXF94_21710 [Halomonas sp. Choline-3u-9]|nr:hypothetical protein CXF94_21710 [Halomonas sp. Choline-3u-9]